MVGRAVPERWRHMVSELDCLQVVKSWLVPPSHTWVFHFSPQKSAPGSQLHVKTGCWYAEIKSLNDKISQAATTAHLGLEGL